MMRLSRFRIRTLMIAVAVLSVPSAVASYSPLCALALLEYMGVALLLIWAAKRPLTLWHVAAFLALGCAITYYLAFLDHLSRLTKW
jgi:hypothetical protein